MSISVKKVTLAEQHSQNDGQLLNNNYLDLLGAVEVQCSIRIGTLKMTIAELRQLKSEQVLRLDQKTHEPVELVLNDKIIARGELMAYEDNFAIHITQVAN